MADDLLLASSPLTDYEDLPDISDYLDQVPPPTNISPVKQQERQPSDQPEGTLAGVAQKESSAGIPPSEIEQNAPSSAQPSNQSRISALPSLMAHTSLSPVPDSQAPSPNLSNLPSSLPPPPLIMIPPPPATHSPSPSIQLPITGDFSDLLEGFDMDDFDDPDMDMSFDGDVPLPSSQPEERSELLVLKEGEGKGRGKRVSLEGGAQVDGLDDQEGSKRRKVELQDEEEEELGLDLSQHPASAGSPTESFAPLPPEDFTQLPQEAFTGFKTGRGSNFKPPSQAALLAAAKLLDAVSDEEAQKMMLAKSAKKPSESNPIIPPPSTLPSPMDTEPEPEPLTQPKGLRPAPLPPLFPPSSAVEPSPKPVLPLAPPPFPHRPSADIPIRARSPAPSSSSTPLRPNAFKIPSSSRTTTPSLSTAARTSTTPIRTPSRTFKPPSASLTSSTLTSTPLRRVGVNGGLGMTARLGTPGLEGGGRRGKRTSFNTPFKVGVKEGDVRGDSVGSVARERKVVNGGVTVEKGKEIEGKGKIAKGKGREMVFDLSPVPGRQTMEAAYIRPAFYSKEELIEYEIPSEIWEINPLNAASYSFHLDGSLQLNHEALYDELMQEGCQGLGKDWVENHWRAVLWKLACLVRAKPALFGEEKFSWAEVGRQVRYRYEREYNQGHRSSLKLIHEQVVSPSSAIVLCVSQITQEKVEPSEPGGGAVAGGLETVLELTDGWYNIRATLDGCLASAVKRRKLKIGCKIGIQGARLEAKEGGSSPLAGLNSSHLILTGNTTSLCRWDTRLGFQPRPFVACLASLSPEGGLIPTMDIVVEKCFPIGYVDVIDPAVGGPQVGQPRGEKDELILQDKWNDRQEGEKLKIAHELEKKLEDLLGWIDKVDRHCKGTRIKADNGDAKAEDLYDEFENAEDKTSFLKTTQPGDLAQLAAFMRRKYQEDGSRMGQDIMNEIDERCPPREVRSFRVVRFRDFRTTRPALRNGQLTLWDATSFGEEGLVEGKRYLVFNLAPGQKGSWVFPRQAGDIYLNSRKDTKWREVS